MTSFRQSLEAFFHGEIELRQLERALEQCEPDERPAVTAALEEAFSSGRLPAQVYRALTVKLRPQSSTAARAPSPPTAAAPPEPATELTIREESRSEATVLARADATQLVVDATLRVTPVERTRLLDRDASGGQSRGTGSNWAHPEQWRASDAGPIQPGSVIKNRFTIESELGKGGMGVVFKARDARKEEAGDDDPYVAIKILNDEFRNHPQSLVALQREASKAQTLAHPNVVTVYDFDRDGTTVYMTMELMRGESLSERIRRSRRGGVPREEALPIILEMAAGLSYAHKRNIVHSDFKPGNVFVTDDQRVKVLDFGIARATKDTSIGTNKAKFDAADLGALTPGYASLEMWNGEPAHAADDVYALAVTAYQLLTGEHPFNRRTAAEALEEGLKPRPIKGLKRREWKTIASGLAFRRAERIQDAETFLRKFRGPTTVTKSAAALIVLLLGLSVYFAIPRDPKPLFPEQSLPADVRTELHELLDDGNFYLDNGQPGFAFEDFHRAFLLHPNNPEALDGLKAVASLTIEEASHATSASDMEDVLEEIETYSVNEYLAGYKRLQNTRVELKERLALEVPPIQD